MAGLIIAMTVTAQPADGPRGPARAGRGGPPLAPEEMTAMNDFNSKLSAETLAVTVASSNLTAAAFITPKDEATIVAAGTALAKAREAWAKKASEEFAKVQASPKKLSDAVVAQLIATIPGTGGRGGPGGGFPGGRRGPGGDGPRGR